MRPRYLLAEPVRVNIFYLKFPGFNDNQGKQRRDGTKTAPLALRFALYLFRLLGTPRHRPDLKSHHNGTSVDVVERCAMHFLLAREFREEIRPGVAGSSRSREYTVFRNIGSSNFASE